MFDPEHPTVTVCPMTSEMNNEAMYRLTIMPDENNGLRLPSQIQIDKTQAIWRHRFGEQIGKASPALMAEVDVALRRWLDL